MCANFTKLIAINSPWCMKTEIIFFHVGLNNFQQLLSL